VDGNGISVLGEGFSVSGTELFDSDTHFSSC
jgi:hypothetical protein